MKKQGLIIYTSYNIHVFLPLSTYIHCREKAISIHLSQFLLIVFIRRYVFIQIYLELFLLFHLRHLYQALLMIIIVFYMKIYPLDTFRSKRFTYLFFSFYSDQLHQALLVIPIDMQIYSTDTFQAKCSTHLFFLFDSRYPYQVLLVFF